MLISFIRTMILYTILIVVIRLMGKRQLGEMEPMEFVVTMLLANLAAVPMQETGIPLLSGLIPILVVLSMELLLSVLVYHSVGARRLLCGKPVILMENGRLLQENLKKTRITPDELTEFLRIEGITDLASVKYAILETSGQVSVLPYAKFKPASAKAAGVQVEDTNLPVTVISDGQILAENLPKLGKNRAWVESVLQDYACRATWPTCASHEQRNLPSPGRSVGDMRHILLSCVILLLALAFCLFSMLHVRDICRKTLDLLSSAQTAAERNDFETCRASMQDAALHWKRYERYFGLALRHEEVDDVISRFAALNQYAVLADRDDFLAGCAELMSAVRHLREMELPTVENIL